MKKIKSILRFLFSTRFLGLIVVVFISFIVLSNLIIVLSSHRWLYDDIHSISPSKTAVVLGTSRFIKGGGPNLYFHYRISAAAELYHAGKVQYLIVSGDNRTVQYNEPEQMRRELLKYGVPDSIIYLDYAGLRTLDSMVRAREIFGQESFIVVSQKFHNQRAVFLARAHGIEARGFNAADVEVRRGIRTQTREIFARVKAVMDLATGKQPRHLGDEVIIGRDRGR